MFRPYLCCAVGGVSGSVVVESVVAATVALIQNKTMMSKMTNTYSYYLLDVKSHHLPKDCT